MYEFNWEGKELAYKLAQTPSTGTLRPDKESSKNWDDTENLYIEGDNLEVLKLLQKSYFGKVKMIYIDPPYNTGKDFVYHDNFRDNIANYKEITNQTTKANPETNGSYHTNWLNMMYPRLKLARNLLREDGVIFISIDDNEVDNLKKLCNEIFGEENFIAQLPTIMNLKGNNDQYGFAGTHEYTLVYCKNKNVTNLGYLKIDKDEINEWQQDSYGYYKKGANLKSTGVNAPREKRPNLFFPLYINKNNEISLNRKNESDIEILPITDGKEMSWRWSKEKFINEPYNLIITNNEGNISIYKKTRALDGESPSKKPKSLFYKPEYSSGNGTNDIKKLFGEKVFENPKPLELLKDFIMVGNYPKVEDNIILDLFSGSGSMAHSVMLYNEQENTCLKFIMVQLPEQTDEKSDAYKAGYKNICEIGKERIRRAGDKIVSENKDKEGIENLDIGFKVFKLDYNKGDNKMYNDKLMNPIEIKILNNKKPKELKSKKKIATINKDADYKVQVFIDDDYNLYYQDNHSFASCESEIVDNKVKTTWNSCKCWFKIIGLYKRRNNHIVDILRDLNEYSEHLYPKNNVADNMTLSRLYEQMVNIYLDYINKNK